MRLGAPVFIENPTPESYLEALIQKGYRAAICPPDLTTADTAILRAYREAFAKHDITLAEVGAWCNPLSPDAAEAKKNTDHVIERLALAEEIGATCCVNILGTYSDVNWFAPCAANFSEDFFAHSVDKAREVIDAVKPTHTTMTFELMATYFLDSPAEYLRFLKAVDRPAAGIHVDPINCISSPRMLYDSARFFEEGFALLGAQTLSIHLKDLAYNPDYFSVVLQEVPLGEGDADIRALLRAIGKLPADTPVILEHLPDEASFDKAAALVRQICAEEGIAL